MINVFNALIQQLWIIMFQNRSRQSELAGDQRLLTDDRHRRHRPMHQAFSLTGTEWLANISESVRSRLISVEWCWWFPICLLILWSDDNEVCLMKVFFVNFTPLNSTSSVYSDVYFCLRFKLIYGPRVLSVRYKLVVYNYVTCCIYFCHVWKMTCQQHHCLAPW